MSFATSKLPDKLVTTYLQMNEQAEFRPAYLDQCSRLNIMQLEVPDVAFYRFLYSAVGEPWRWRDRLLLGNDEIQAILMANILYLLYVEGVPAGYIELAPSCDSTEIAYFGLRSMYMGRGLGKHLLSYGIASAWDNGAKRLWVHTCNLDSPYALDNYIKRGFSIYKVHEQPMPERYL